MRHKLHEKEISDIFHRKEAAINEMLIEMQDETAEIYKSGINELQKKMEGGCYLRAQDDKWHLFNTEADSIVSGDSVYDIVIQLWEKL